MSKEVKLNTFVIIMFVLVGALTGSLIAEACGAHVPFLARGLNVGLTPPAVIDLYIFTFTIGFTFKFNLGTAIGAAIGFFTAKKFA